MSTEVLATESPELVANEPPLRSVHTSAFADFLAREGLTLAVTTYQAGKLVLLRGEDGQDKRVINTHFKSFNRPMGFAWERGRFALGTGSEIAEFHDIPSAGRKRSPSDSELHHDAVFVPRNFHVTGDIQVHEMAWLPCAGKALSDLWFVNTRFSCLCTMDHIFSFIPQWQPPFISALAPEDRCHLNGVGIRDGQVRYVTALGESDTPGGWRQQKRAGGLVMDVQADKIIARGLSMPHSPRWHQGKLWVLESGCGGMGTIDLVTGRYEELCRLPGFTRGLDLIGNIAFVGLSQVRESATFSDIEITELPQEKRCCGVWAIDTRSGNTLGFVKFTDAVQEIFAVQALHGIRWPEVLGEDRKRIAEIYELPDEALNRVPSRMRADLQQSGSET